VLALSPEHISAYSLILEEGTEFYRMAEKGELPLPDEDTERELYALTRDLLSASGYRRYEFSNFAKEGYQCRHNVRYWKCGDYLGFGIGAASLFEGRRWRNTRDLELYLKSSADPRFLVRDMEQLSLRSEIEEHMFLGLRMTEGVTEEEFEKRFHVQLLDIYGEILDRQIGEGVMATDGRGRYYLTERGIEVSNVVLADFLMDQ
jgi:oxygen-independent coproporphyrinogen-3 oxidase